MKKWIPGLLALCLVLTGCGSSGPDRTALPPLETAPQNLEESRQAYDRSEPVVIYEENLEGGVRFSLYEDGKLELTGGDVLMSMTDEPAFHD